jgi:2-isopropylmalate synthase
VIDVDVEIYDTTLRDGSQQEGISLTVNDKLAVAGLLDDLGVAFIEGGWPGANQKDTEFFARAGRELDLRRSTLTAFGSTRRPGLAVGSDPMIAPLLDAGTEYVCIVGKSSAYQVVETLQTDLDEGVRLVGETVDFLKAHDRRVFFDAEHFFDGFRFDPRFSLRVLQAAHHAGAERLVLCDTNGGSLPDEILRAVASVQEAIPDAVLGVHLHNDTGCAVAGSLAAVGAGVPHVQGCMNGYGERTGNTDLSALIPNLRLKLGHDAISGDLDRLSPIAHHIAEIVNIALDPHRPYVGSSAFTHKAGLHASALVRKRDAYEHERPETVGNQTRMVVSELAGRATVVAKANELGLDISDEEAKAVVELVKELEHQGYQFEAADGSLELLIRRHTGWTNSFFDSESFEVVTRRTESGVRSTATVDLIVDGEARQSRGEGVGPVHAMDVALRAALDEHYPGVSGLRLTDYRVRVLDSDEGTSARVRVLLETSDDHASWGTIGVHENVIEASWEALTEGLIIGLIRQNGHDRSGMAQSLAPR